MAVKVLKAELRQTFAQREIELMRCKLRYYQKKTGNKTGQSSELMLTFDFHWIWEHIGGEVLGNVYKQIESSLIPQLCRHILTGQKEKVCKKGLTEAGWLVLRFWESDIKISLDFCIKEIEKFL